MEILIFLAIYQDFQELKEIKNSDLINTFVIIIVSLKLYNFGHRGSEGQKLN